MNDGTISIRSIFAETKTFLIEKAKQVITASVLSLAVLFSAIYFISRDSDSIEPIYTITDYNTLYLLCINAIYFFTFIYIINLYYGQTRKMSTYIAFTWSDRHTRFLVKFVIGAVLIIASNTAIVSIITSFILFMIEILHKYNIEYSSVSMYDLMNPDNIYFYIALPIRIFIYVISVGIFSLILAYYTPALLTSLIDRNRDIVTDTKTKDYDPKNRFFWVLFIMSLLYYSINQIVFPLLSHAVLDATWYIPFTLPALSATFELILVIFTAAALAITNRRIILAPVKE